jgi:hypothetical protein
MASNLARRSGYSPSGYGRLPSYEHWEHDEPRGSRDITRRDPRYREHRDPVHHEESSPNYLLWLLLIGGAGFLGYKFLIEPKLAAAQAQQPGALPGPGGQPNLPPSPNPNVTPPGQPQTFFGGDQAEQGDLIYVSTAAASSAFSALQPFLGGASIPTTVAMIVTAATTGSPTVDAITIASPPVPAGIPATVPRTAITTTVRGSGTLPSQPVVPPPAPGGNVIPPLPNPIPSVLPTDLGNPVPLKQGQHYRARIQLDGLTALAATPTAVAQQFQGMGFTDLHVYGASDQLPANWPAGTVIAPSNSTYYVEGTWGGADTQLPRPPEIVYVWQG